MKKQIILTLFLVVFSVLLMAQSNQIVVHDPVAIEFEGKYHMYSTGVGIASWYSNDLEHWHFLAQVLDPIPAWAKEKVPDFNGNTWAPDVAYHNGLYYLYYSISSFASNRSCIGVTTNKTLDINSADYKWIDHGTIIESVPGRDNWNAIDPNLIFDENNIPWMSFGSFWGGLKIVKMNDDLISISEPQEWHGISARNRNFDLDETDPGNAAVEAPFIFKKNDYFYLFVSFDLCCRGERSTYNVRVGRSKSAIGPYFDKEGKSMMQGGGTLIVEGNEEYYGIGHNSVYTFDGKDYMFSHGYDIKDKGKPKLVRHQLEWDNEDWPIAKELK